MAHKQLKGVAKQTAAILLAFSIAGSVFYAPVFTPKAEAQFAVIDIKAWARELIDAIAMNLAQKMVDDMVKSTIKWANTGFNGNPAFVTKPGVFALNVADRAAGDFLKEEGGPLAFLCSPFQTNIRLALTHDYYEPVEDQYQCSLSGVVENIEGFYKDFNQGGWDAWFVMTQNPTSNPYGAYLKASVELDERVANALSLSKTELDRGDGFLSLKECDAYNPGEAALDAINKGLYNGVSRGELIEQYGYYDLTYPADACVKPGKIKTAGTTIKTQLDRVLPAGLEKLVHLEHVEQLIGAFANGLLKRYVFGEKGLFGDNYADHLNESNSSPISKPQELECFVNPETATAGETRVTWSAFSNFGLDIDYTWSGDLLTGATSSSVSLIYPTAGVKTASVTASTTNSDGVRIERTANCPNVAVSGSAGLLVSCSPKSPGIIEYNTPIQWEARITGGSGRFRTIQWDGQQGHVPGESGDEFRMWPHGDTTSAHIEWTYTIKKGAVIQIFNKDDKGVTYQDNVKNGNTTISTITRVYLRDNNPIENVDARVTVYDADPTLVPVTAECRPNLNLRD